MEFPITIHDLTATDDDMLFKPAQGDKAIYVSVRPLGEEYQQKTYLGFLLGETPLSIAFGTQEMPDGKGLALLLKHTQFNPMIFIPELNRIVLGVESWWGIINGPEDLRAITDQTIENVWYVQALRSLELQQATKEADATATEGAASQ